MSILSQNFWTFNENGGHVSIDISSGYVQWSAEIRYSDNLNNEIFSLSSYSGIDKSSIIIYCQTGDINTSARIMFTYGKNIEFLCINRYNSQAYLASWKSQISGATTFYGNLNINGIIDYTYLKNTKNVVFLRENLTVMKWDCFNNIDNNQFADTTTSNGRLADLWYSDLTICYNSPVLQLASINVVNSLDNVFFEKGNKVSDYFGVNAISSDNTGSDIFVKTIDSDYNYYGSNFCSGGSFYCKSTVYKKLTIAMTVEGIGVYIVKADDCNNFYEPSGNGLEPSYLISFENYNGTFLSLGTSGRAYVRYINENTYEGTSSLLYEIFDHVQAQPAKTWRNNQWTYDYAFFRSSIELVFSTKTKLAQGYNCSYLYDPESDQFYYWDFLKDTPPVNNELKKIIAMSACGTKLLILYSEYIGESNDNIVVLYDVYNTTNGPVNPQILSSTDSLVSKVVEIKQTDTNSTIIFSNGEVKSWYSNQVSSYEVSVPGTVFFAAPLINDYNATNFIKMYSIGLTKDIAVLQISTDKCHFIFDTTGGTQTITGYAEYSWNLYIHNPNIVTANSYSGPAGNFSIELTVTASNIYRETTILIYNKVGLKIIKINQQIEGINVISMVSKTSFILNTPNSAFENAVIPILPVKIAQGEIYSSIIDKNKQIISWINTSATIIDYPDFPQTSSFVNVWQSKNFTSAVCENGNAYIWKTTDPNIGSYINPIETDVVKFMHDDTIYIALKSNGHLKFGGTQPSTLLEDIPGEKIGLNHEILDFFFENDIIKIVRRAVAKKYPIIYANIFTENLYNLQYVSSSIGIIKSPYDVRPSFDTKFIKSNTTVTNAQYNKSFTNNYIPLNIVHGVIDRTIHSDYFLDFDKYYYIVIDKNQRPVVDELLNLDDDTLYGYKSIENVKSNIPYNFPNVINASQYSGVSSFISTGKITPDDTYGIFNFYPKHIFGPNNIDQQSTNISIINSEYAWTVETFPIQASSWIKFSQQSGSIGYLYDLYTVLGINDTQINREAMIIFKNSIADEIIGIIKVVQYQPEKSAVTWTIDSSSNISITPNIPNIFANSIMLGIGLPMSINDQFACASYISNIPTYLRQANPVYSVTACSGRGNFMFNQYDSTPWNVCFRTTAKKYGPYITNDDWFWANWSYRPTDIGTDTQGHVSLVQFEFCLDNSFSIALNSHGRVVVSSSIGNTGFVDKLVTLSTNFINFNIVSISAGSWNSYPSFSALYSDGTVAVHTMNKTSTETFNVGALYIDQLSGIVKISQHANYFIGLKSDKTIVSWMLINSNTTSPISIETATFQEIILNQNNFYDIVNISCGVPYSMAIQNSGDIIIWNTTTGELVNNNFRLSGYAISQLGNYKNDGKYYSMAIMDAYPISVYVVNKSAQLINDNRILVNGEGLYAENSPCTLSYTNIAPLLYKFVGWFNGTIGFIESLISNESPHTLTAYGPQTILAVFDSLYQVSTTSNISSITDINSKITGSGYYTTIDTCKVSTPLSYTYVNSFGIKKHYLFSYWREYQYVTTISTNNLFSFQIVDADTITYDNGLIYNFHKIPITLSADYSPNAFEVNLIPVIDKLFNVVGGGSTEGSGIYTNNATVQIQAAADIGYAFEGWYIDSYSLSNMVFALEQGQFSGVAIDLILYAKFAVTINIYYVPLESSVDGINYIWYASYGEHRTFVADPIDGATFTAWYGGPDINSLTVLQTDPTLKYTVSTPAVLVALFTPVYDIIVNIVPPAAGTSTGSGVYIEDQKCQVAAYPISACSESVYYLFSHWTENGQIIDWDNPYANISDEFTVSSSRTFDAVFSFTIELVVVPEGAGNATSQDNKLTNFYKDDGCTLTATPITTEYSYEFKNWIYVACPIQSSTIISQLPIYSFNIQSAGTYIANFGIKYTIQASGDSNNIGRVNQQVIYTAYIFENDICTLIATTINQNYKFAYWSEAGEKIENIGNTYSFIVKDNRILVAHYEEVFYVNIEYDPTTIVVIGEGPYISGETVVITVMPKGGYIFDGMYDADSATNINLITNGNSYEFIISKNMQFIINTKKTIISIESMFYHNNDLIVAGTTIDNQTMVFELRNINMVKRPLLISQKQLGLQISGKTNVIAVDIDDELLIGTTNGCFKFDDTLNQWNKIPQISGSVTSITRDYKNRLIVAGNFAEKVLRYENSVWYSLILADNGFDDADNFNGIGCNQLVSFNSAENVLLDVPFIRYLKETWQISTNICNNIQSIIETIRYKSNVETKVKIFISDTGSADWIQDNLSIVTATNIYTNESFVVDESTIIHAGQWLLTITTNDTYRQKYIKTVVGFLDSDFSKALITTVDFDDLIQSNFMVDCITTTSTTTTSTTTTSTTATSTTSTTATSTTVSTTTGDSTTTRTTVSKTVATQSTITVVSTTTGSTNTTDTTKTTTIKSTTAGTTVKPKCPIQIIDGELSPSTACFKQDNGAYITFTIDPTRSDISNGIIYFVSPDGAILIYNMSTNTWTGGQSGSVINNEVICGGCPCVIPEQFTTISFDIETTDDEGNPIQITGTAIPDSDDPSIYSTTIESPNNPNDTITVIINVTTGTDSGSATVTIIITKGCPH